MPYVPHTPEDARAMLETVGVSSVEELFAEIPLALRPKSFDLPPGLSESDTRAKLEDMASRNNTALVSFLGAGFYDHYVPSAVDALTGRGEFYTAYTPYQPEASQGTLQAIFEYQTAVSRLLGMDCANASVYDGGTALCEAVMMAVRQTKRTKVLISETVNPIYRILVDTFTRNLHLSLVTVPHREGATDFAAMQAALDKETACVVVQNPNFFGRVQDASALFSAAKAVGAVSVLSAYPVLASVLKTPGAMGADVAVAEGQSLGLPLSFGGPYLGVMTCTKALVRQMPGRIVGRTEDSKGRTGYVLTLQAREQHIRRQKATSNICSNQALCALRSLAHLCLLGEEGLKRTALLSMENARYAAGKLTAIKGVSLLGQGPIGNEFAVTLPRAAQDVCLALIGRGLVPGFPLGRYYQGLENALLVCCTEKTSKRDIDILAAWLEDEL
ncbi:putative glycine dehydrogenase (decarboxylating) subunit 1 [Fundidesulfovibrio magnetotacticus]|uniref:Probable glycine dehydrogenase (decarboxylating) subunit 1 n=1 Tax=Fundidesulfovibrio magnetotacticus TaxID=2730080 RepID=A0A6V8LQW9_9BACT|nr:aminomethyl-transferring glycine dehydrogenase subunit GcvPA [Fundidesulfovibrio magnetotacticus]GFK92738.1 putative glycine dehydrogenase (decarboxylating) subunit 1 [Fundidesulfovibrio magnetotacticus]